MARADANRSTRLDARTVAEVAQAARVDPVAVYSTPDGKDPFSAAWHHIGKFVDARRTGIDVTISAPKSISVLAGLADEKTAARIEACHFRAVEQALGYLQRHAGHAFRGHHGDGQQLSQIGTDGWIIAAFTDHTRRADDPQLHTHLVVPNLLRGEDGRWSEIDSRAVHRHVLQVEVAMSDLPGGAVGRIWSWSSSELRSCGGGRAAVVAETVPAARCVPQAELAVGA